MNHRLGHITTEPIRSSLKPPSPVYYKPIFNHLKSLAGLNVSPGLTNQEISAVESSLGFSFPLDLRSILQSGLPVDTNFPNWRFGVKQDHLFLPLYLLSKIVVRNGLWVDSWGTRPGNEAEILSLVKKLTEVAPVLVPVYGNFYVPSTTPNLAGNPVFQIDSDGVRELPCDVAEFLQRLGRLESPTENCRRKRRRSVEFWSDLAENGRFIARDTTREWWTALVCERLGECLDDAFWKLREGGWTEDEVRDMMMIDGVDRDMSTDSPDIVYEFENGCRTGVDEEDEDTCTEEEDHLKRGEVTTLRQLLLYEH